MQFISSAQVSNLSSNFSKIVIRTHHSSILFVEFYHLGVFNTFKMTTAVTKTKISFNKLILTTPFDILI